jgi:hypothetical protein
MELDDLKNTWDAISSQVKEQNHLSPEIIDQMTQKKYYYHIKKIAFPEIIGSIICLTGAFFIGVKFYKLDTAFFQGVGVLSILLLLALSIISWFSLRQFNIIDVNKPYAETVKIFASRKLTFFKLQKVNVILSYLLLVTIIILMAKLFNGRDITDSKYFWIYSFSVGYLLLMFYSKRVSKYYAKTVRQAEELLQELQA